MQCKNCGEYLQPGSTFCTKCGYRIDEYPDDTDGYYQEQKRNPSNTYMYVILAVVLALVLATAYLIFIRDGSSKPEPEPTATASLEPTATPTVTPTPTPSATPTPTPTPTETVPVENYYLLPYSNSRKLTDADLAPLSHEQLCFARNEIFARYGRKFETPQLARYFESQPWYKGTISASAFDEDVLNAIEKENVRIISEYERKHYGGSYY